MNRYKKRVKLLEAAKEIALDIGHDAVCEKLKTNSEFNDIEPIDLEDMFGNKNPIEVEIGFGLGKFMLEYMANRPNVNYLGIEITGKLVKHVANKICKAKIANSIVTQYDARYFLKYKIKPESVDRVHIYFPDPWPKKRHAKRRVVNLELLESIYSALKVGGKLNLFTDSKDYFDYFNEINDGYNKFKVDQVAFDEYVPTTYELKWINMGRTINRAILIKE